MACVHSTGGAMWMVFCVVIAYLAICGSMMCALIACGLLDRASGESDERLDTLPYYGTGTRNAL